MAGQGFAMQDENPSGFETFDADQANLADDAKMECGVCWHVYDPAEGDGVAQIPAGTPFSQLPEDWCCPNCDGPKRRFMQTD